MSRNQRFKSPQWPWAIVLGIIILTPFNLFGKPMPEFFEKSSDKWINSEPLTKSDLKGKVVLIDIWTTI